MTSARSGVKAMRGLRTDPAGRTLDRPTMDSHDRTPLCETARLVRSRRVEFVRFPSDELVRDRALTRDGYYELHGLAVPA